MAKQLNIKLNFEANTKAAEQALSNLQVNLNKIATMQSPGLGSQLSKDLSIAKQSAQDLQQHLINAFNVKTGNLDLSRLDTSLKSAGQSLGGLSTNLLKAGQTGQQAFLNIQQSIAHASVQINQANGLLTQFWTTLKNTARWQISSSILHGFMGSLQSAWSYAKNLDESLNNIRIVTGYNTDQMSKFAEQANKAAKALSTTTTDYTNASLIYYQQGLSEADVQARTNVTIKMANASRQSAEIVSDQLTAIWNNFDNGTKSLEYYADVITALGAATASSSEEISDGLEKFAAVAETVGLSYEYATAALATVTATTRQSADVVGTSFKTLFARLNDLKLGETLDDGTTLGQYTENLAKIGVNIQDASGRLKDMDDILNETAAKWETLDKAQQVALAKGVAGIRQYTQFIALMDNWDFMQENLKTVESSSGTLQKQADIYAESWEAATDRVKAAAQGIYRDLLPTEELTGMADGFAVFLEGIDGIVRGLGGLEGILLAISTIVLNVFQRQLGSALDAGIAKVATFGTTLVSKFKNIPSVWQQFINGASTSAAKTNQLANNVQSIATNAANGAKQMEYASEHLEKGVSLATKYSMEMAQSSYQSEKMSGNMRTYSTNLLAVNNVQAMIEQSSKYLTSEQRTQLSILQEQTLQANEQLLAANDHYKLVQLENDALLSRKGDNVSDFDRYDAIEANGKSRMEYSSTVMNTGTAKEDAQQILDIYTKQYAELERGNVVLASRGNTLTVQMDQGDELVGINQKANQNYSQMYAMNIKIAAVAKDTTRTEEERKKKINEIKEQYTSQNKVLAEILNKEKNLDGSSEQIAEAVARATAKQREFAEVTGSSDKHLSNIESKQNAIYIAEERQAAAQDNFNNKLQQASTLLQNGLKSAMSWGNVLSKAAGGISSVAMGISAVSNAFETFSDEDASFTSKLSAGAMAATMGISALTTVLSGLQAIIQGVNAVQTLNNITQAVNNTLKEKELNLTTKEGMAEAANLIVQKLGIAEDQKESATKFILNKLKKQGIKETIKDTAANYANAASQAAKYWQLTLIIAALGVVAGLIYAVVKANQADEEAAKRASEAATNLAEAHKEAVDKLAALKSALSTYDEAVEKLNNCVKGTNEWNTALTEVNNTLLDLLNTYPDVFGKAGVIVRDEATGALTINEEMRAALLQQAEQEVQIKSLAANLGAISASRARSTVRANDLEEKINKKTKLLTWVGTSNDENSSSEGSVSSAGLQHLDLGTILKRHASELIKLNEEEYRDTVKELLIQYSTETVRSFEGFEKQIDNIVEESVQYQQSISELGDSAQGAAEKLKTISRIIVQEQLGNSYTTDEQDVAANILSQNEAVYKQAYIDLMKGGGLRDKISTAIASSIAAETLGWKDHGDLGIAQISGSDNKVYQFIASELEKYDLGYTAATGNTVQGNDDNRELVFLDKSGDKVQKSAEYWAELLASAKALKGLGVSAEDARSALQNLAKNAPDDVSSGIQEFMTNKTMNTLSQADRTGIMASMDDDGDSSLSQEEVIAYLKESLGVETDEQLTKLFGVDSVDTIYADWTKAWSANEKALANAGSQLTKTTKAMFDNLDLENLDVTQQDILSKALNQAFINTGAIGAQLISDLFTSMADPKQQQTFIDTLDSIDWPNATVSDLRTQFLRAGIAIDATDEDLSLMIDSMQKKVTSVSSSITSEYKKINDIIKELSAGSTISSENYGKLSNEQKKYFMLTLDGTYKLIEDAQKLKNILESTTIQKLSDNINDLQNTKTTLQFLQSNFDFSTDKLKGDVPGQTYVKPEVAYGPNTFKRVQGENAIAIKDDGLISTTNLTTWIELLSLVNGASEATIKEWEVAIEKGVELDKTSAEVSAAVKTWTDSVGGQEAAQEMLNQKLAQTNAEMRKSYEQIASSADSIKQLNQMLAEGKIDVDAYTKAWMALNSEIDLAGLDEKELAGYTTYLQGMLGIGENTARDMAKSNMKIVNGVKSLQENYKNWFKTITTATTKAARSTYEYYQAISGVKAAFGQLLDINPDVLPDDFYQDVQNLEWMRQAAAGSATALAELRKEALDTIIVSFELKDEVESELRQAISNIESDIANMDPLTLEATLDSEEFIKSCNAMVTAASLTGPQIESMFDAMGYSVQLDYITEDVPTPTTYTTIHEYVTTDTDDGCSKEIVQIPTTNEITTDSAVSAWAQNVYASNGEKKTNSKPVITGVAKKPSTPPTISPTETSKKPSRPKRNDYLKRYKEQDDALDDIADAMERVNKQADRLYGEDRINALKKQNELLLKQRDILKDKQSAATIDLELDKADLDLVAKKHGIEFKYDKETGNIINYTQALTPLKNKLLQYKTEAYEKGDSEYKKEEIEKLETKLQEIQDAINLYEETRELIEDNKKAIEDAFYEWQDNNYEQIHYKLELELAINDTELRMIDYYLNKIADDFYSMSEAANKIRTEKVDTIVNSLQDYEDFKNKLDAKFDAKEISQEKYIEGLKETFDATLDNLEALQDLDKEMQHYYEDTLSAGAEELAIYTSHMEHLTSVLDHYQNIVTMMNGEMDFDNIGTILEGKASTLNNEMKVAESNYAMLKAEQAAMQAAYDAADDEGKKYLKSSLDAINAQVDEAYEAMLSKTKEWAEAQRAIMENSMKKAAHEMEMAFTNNMGFAALNSSMDRLSSYSNEYLTKTNQIYETQKLMNTAQQAIDKTTNQAAKVRLENYNKEIKQLQEKNKLSNLELDIAKAKYDVLLAEIALEEAQNAKATVRLQRDSEGNYGYVYTADKENIAKAEQDLADAQNALYNIGLEGANDYGSKLLDLQQQLADELIALEQARAAGQYKTDEEYYAAKERLISEYNNLFEAYSDQYTTALGVDTAIQQEAWVNAYDEMILKTEDWQIHVDEYTVLCEESYSHWREIVQAESDIVTDLLGNVSDAVKNVTDESNNLKDKIVKEVIPAIENEYTQVRKAVLAYEGLRDGLQLTIKEYEKLAEKIQEAMRQQALFAGQTNLPEDPDVPGEEEEEVSPEEPNNKIGHSEMMALVDDIMVHGAYGNDPQRTNNILDTEKYTAEDRAAAQQIINDIARNKDAAAAWRTGKNWDKVLDEYVSARGYASGGYTGAWGPEGKLAWLHEKEIVLNARDTENFLAATGILRDISKMIDLNSIQNQMAQLSAVGMTNAAHQILEQAVSIEAHFPNVTDRNEIEEAFNNLINTASQYANRKF